MGELFTIIFTNPIINILVGFYTILNFLHIPYALGFSIILLTAVVKIILWPTASSQIKTASKMQKITPHMNAIKEKHKEDKKRQQEEMMRLYKEHGVNPAAGCLPLLIQLPVIWSLYNVLTKVVDARSLSAIEKINNVLYFDFMRLNHVWDSIFFGFSLSGIPTNLIGTMPVVILVPVLSGVLQFVLSKMMMPETPTATNKDDFQSSFQSQSLFIFPILIGFFSFTLPIGLSLYWNTFSLFGILQQYLLVGPGAMKPWVEKVKKK